MVSKSKIRGALYGSVSGAALLMMAAPMAFAADDGGTQQIDPQVMQQLQAKIAAIKSRLQNLKSNQDQVTYRQNGDTSASVILDPAPVSNAVASHEEALEGDRGKRPAAPADAVVGGDFPQSFKLPGSDTSVSIRGYVKADFLYDFQQNVGDSFQSSLIAPTGSAANHFAEFRFGARESRLIFETRTPSSYGDLKTYIETDFYGGGSGPLGVTGASSFVTNSYIMRLRHAYAQIGPLLVGQTWTTFQNDIGSADTLDFDGPTGVAFSRQAQVRYTQSFGKWQIALSAENPQTLTVTNPGAATFIPTGTGFGASYGNGGVVSARVPDFIGRLEYSDDWGALQGSVLTHNERIDTGTPTPTIPIVQKDNTQQFGGLLALWLQNFWGNDTFGIESSFGAVGRYLDTPSQDSVLYVASPTTVKLATQNMWGGALYYTHFWRDDLRSTVAYGHSHFYINHMIGTPTEDSIQTVHANLIWSPVKNVDTGIEFMWGETHFGNAAPGSPAFQAVFPGASKNTGDDERLQVSFKAKFD
jgi:hypothetical protein